MEEKVRGNEDRIRNQTKIVQQSQSLSRKLISPLLVAVTFRDERCHGPQWLLGKGEWMVEGRPRSFPLPRMESPSHARTETNGYEDGRLFGHDIPVKGIRSNR